MSIGAFPESLSQAMLLGTMLVRRLGVIQRNVNLNYMTICISGVLCSVVLCRHVDGSM